METREFFRRYSWVYCYAVSLCLVLAAGISSGVTAVSSAQALARTPVVILDAGHGGIDGGAVSCTGVPESRINLEIARRTEALMRLLGYETVMTRQTEDSVATEGETIRQQKRSDLRNRVQQIARYPGGTLLSIHQNQFADSGFSGPQVFYADTPGSQELARNLQEQLTESLSPGNTRRCKRAEGVYLLKHVDCRAVLVECGFLSNPREEAALRSAAYQKKLACVLAGVLAQQMQTTGES